MARFGHRLKNCGLRIANCGMNGLFHLIRDRSDIQESGVTSTLRTRARWRFEQKPRSMRRSRFQRTQEFWTRTANHLPGESRRIHFASSDS
jgi:hypothetical protein